MARFGRCGIAFAFGMAANGVLASGIANGFDTGISMAEAERQARAAITAAQRDVNRARDKQALWTVAEDALGNARRAHANGNRALAIEQARLASDFAKLGIEQQNFPLVR